jgi:hypothetical protein
MKEHKWAAEKGHKTHLYNAIRKYGPENFVISLLEETNDTAERECYYISSLSPEYNMTKGGDGVVMRSKRICITDGLREWYIEANASIPEGCRRGRAPKNIPVNRRGHSRSQEAKDKTAMKHKGMKRTEESKLKMSLAAKSRKSYLRGDRHGMFGMHWWNNGSESCVSQFCPAGWKKGRLSQKR